MEKKMICGGLYTKTCLNLTPSGWQKTTDLLEYREDHSSWAAPGGLILMGGLGSSRTTEKIQEDGTSAYSFDLKYRT